MSSSDSLENLAAGGSRCAHSRSRRHGHVDDFPRRWHSDDEKRYHDHEGRRVRIRRSSRERTHNNDEKRAHSAHYGSRRSDCENDNYSSRRRHRSSDRAVDPDMHQERVRETPTVESIDAGQSSHRENYRSRRSRYDSSGERNRRHLARENYFAESRYPDHETTHRRSHTRDWKSADEFDDDRRHRRRSRIVRIDSDIDVLGRNHSSEDLACEECGKCFRAESRRCRERRSSSEGRRKCLKDVLWSRRRRQNYEPNKRSYGGSDSETEFLPLIFGSNRTTASTNQITQTAPSLTENQIASDSLRANETLNTEQCQNNNVPENMNYSNLREPQNEQTNEDLDAVRTTSRTEERNQCHLC